MMSRTVSLLDGESLFVEGFKLLLAQCPQIIFEITGVWPSLEQLDYELTGDGPDAVVMELAMPDGDSMDYVRKIRKVWPDTRIMILTRYAQADLIKQAFQAGCDAFVLKTQSTQDLWEAFDAIFRGQTYLPIQLQFSRLVHQKKLEKQESAYQQRDAFLIKTKLTKREVEILKHLTQAKTNKEIADLLYISDQTVGVHRKNIMRKLGVNNAASLINKAFQLNLN